ncbi:hypothetical protein CFAM422_011848 [Trichoderma lentiforme]|uniref:Uncharacterized protein n=1 Tax=Trichoderma lentiforme TaxID=1567552 RepID=A0A9P4X637_9HYPO|nr:hypothetical protein CFAM422_011848 [Trichoderma lentiforme]
MLAANVIRHYANPSFGRAPPRSFSPGMFWSLVTPRPASRADGLQVAVPRAFPPTGPLAPVFHPSLLSPPVISTLSTQTVAPATPAKPAPHECLQPHVPVPSDVPPLQPSPRTIGPGAARIRLRYQERQSATPQPNAVSPPSSPYLDPHLFFSSLRLLAPLLAPLPGIASLMSLSRRGTWPLVHPHPWIARSPARLPARRSE